MSNPRSVTIDSTLPLRGLLRDPAGASAEGGLCAHHGALQLELASRVEQSTRWSAGLVCRVTRWLCFAVGRVSASVAFIRDN